MKLLLLLIMIFGPSGLMAEDSGTDCGNLIENLKNCKKYDCYRISQDQPDFVIHHIIIGQSADGQYCEVEETMPSNKKFSCKYDVKTRQAAARMIELNIKGDANIDENDKALIANAWGNGLCNIVSR